MLPGAVPLVAFNPVSRKAAAGQAHDPVPANLRQDGGGGDGHAPAVTLNDRFTRRGQSAEREPIEKNHVGREGKSGHGPAHGFLGGPQDIDRVDLPGIGRSQAEDGDPADLPG